MKYLKTIRNHTQRTLHFTKGFGKQSMLLLQPGNLELYETSKIYMLDLCKLPRLTFWDNTTKTPVEFWK